jgi:hypothetical protein
MMKMQDSQDVTFAGREHSLFRKMALSLYLAQLAVKLKAVRSFETEGTTRPVTRRHIPDNVKF